MTEAIAAACTGIGPYEAIYVDDASTDSTAADIQRCAPASFLRLIPARPQRRPVGGDPIAACARARGRSSASLDGDGQNPPSEDPEAARPARELRLSGRHGAHRRAAVGRRTRCPRWASKFANGLRSSLLKDGTRDTGCGLKLFRRDAFPSTCPISTICTAICRPCSPATAGPSAHVDVAAYPARHAGRSNYANLSRALVGIHDLFGVMWLIKRRKKAGRP